MRPNVNLIAYSALFTLFGCTCTIIGTSTPRLQNRQCSPTPAAPTLSTHSATFTSLPSGPTIGRLAENLHLNPEDLGIIYIFGSGAELLGGIIAGWAYDSCNNANFVIGTGGAILGLFFSTIPVASLTNRIFLTVCFTLNALPRPLINTGGNLMVVWIRGKKSAPWLNAINGMFGLGATIAPFVADLTWYSTAWMENLDLHRWRICVAYWCVAVCVVIACAIPMLLEAPKSDTHKHLEREERQRQKEARQKKRKDAIERASSAHASERVDSAAGTSSSVADENLSKEPLLSKESNGGGEDSAIEVESITAEESATDADDDGEDADSENDDIEEPDIRVKWFEPILILGVLFMTTATAIEVSVGNWIYTYAHLSPSLQLSSRGASTLNSFYWLTFTAARLVLLPVLFSATTLSPAACLIGSTVLVVVGCLYAIVYNTSVVALYFCAAAAGIGVAPCYGTTVALVREHIPLSGRAQSSFAIATGLGAGLGPFGASAVMGGNNYDRLIPFELSCAFLSLVCSVGMAMWPKRREVIVYERRKAGWPAAEAETLLDVGTAGPVAAPLIHKMHQLHGISLMTPSS
jgi:fucose permease